MKELEKQMMKAMNGGDPVKIVKKITLPNGKVIHNTHVCDCNPEGVSTEIQRKNIKHAVTEIQKLIIEKEGGSDRFRPGGLQTTSSLPISVPIVI